MIEILLIILCSILGTGLILATVGFIYFKKKWNKRKKLREERMAAKLFEKLTTEEDENLRKEIEEAIFEFNSKSDNAPKHSKKKSNKQNSNDILYENCVDFVQKMTKSAGSFLDFFEQNDSKIKQFISNFDENIFDENFNSKDKLNIFSNKVLKFLEKNKNNINKIQQMKDIWNSQ